MFIVKQVGLTDQSYTTLNAILNTVL